MQFSYQWLQEYFEEPLPKIEDLKDILTFHAFEIEGLKGDLIDIDVLPNRSHDCFSYQGIAREIAVLTGLTLKPQEIKYQTKEKLKTTDYLTLQVLDEKLVPRATKRLVKNVNVVPSPQWLREKLEAIGQKSINNVVDVTNFVMWQTGQPVHAFDFDKIAPTSASNAPRTSTKKTPKTLTIRSAHPHETITTLDGQEFELDETMLVISDNEKALDIAGIKGGAVSGIDSATNNIVLSVCNFDQTNIRQTSHRLGLRTDASVRFENGLSPEKVSEALEMLSALIADLAQGEVSIDWLDNYPRPANSYKVGVDLEKVNRILGTNFSEDQMEKILQQLAFPFEKVKPAEKVVELARTIAKQKNQYRMGASVTYDAPRCFDCSSLIAYLFSQVGIAVPRISVDQLVFSQPLSRKDLRPGDLVFSNTEKGKIHHETVEFLKGTVVAEGVDHVGLYLGNDWIVYASRYNHNNGVAIKKMSEDSLFHHITGFGRVINRETNYVVTVPVERLDLRISEDLVEEIGRVFGYEKIISQIPQGDFQPQIDKHFYYFNLLKNSLRDLGFSEVHTYSFCEKGVVEVLKPQASHLRFLRTKLQTGMENSLELNSKNAPLLGLDEVKIFEMGKVFSSLEEEYTSLCLGVAVTGKKKKNEKENKILQEAVAHLSKVLGVELAQSTSNIWEINLEEIVDSLPDADSYGDSLTIASDHQTVAYRSISPYPFVLRDIAVWLPNDKTADDLLELIKKEGGEWLAQTKLFDTYSPEGEEQTSYAFNLVFQSQIKTLTDKEVNEKMDKLTQAVTAQGWQVR